MNLAETLRSAADAEQLTLHPLPTHSLAQASEHSRLQYASVLAALLSAQDAVSEPQSRLLALLLQALDLGDPRAALFEAVRGWDEAALSAALRSVYQADAGRALVLDALVLLRLDAALPEASAQTLADLAAFLGLSEPELAELAHYAALLLGLPTEAAAPAEAEAKGSAKGSAKASTKDAAQAAPPQPCPPEETALLAKHWPSRIPKRLTVNDLRAGIKGGLWFVDKTLEINVPWAAQGATFLFRSGSTLHTTLAQTSGAAAAELALTDCRFVGARLHYTGCGSLKVQDCHLSGHYDPALKVSAIALTGGYLQLYGTYFSVRQARAVASTGANLEVQGCHFTDCGHPELDGGALWHGIEESSYLYIISHSRFERCTGRLGGAVWVNYLKSIKSCEFIDCTSVGRKDEPNLAVNCGHKITHSAGISGCVFRNSSLNLADTSYYNGTQTFVQNSQFHNGQIYFHNKHSYHTIAGNCTFNGGQTIERKIQ